MEAIIDNKDFYSSIHSTKLNQDKRLCIDIATIQEMLRKTKLLIKQIRHLQKPKSLPASQRKVYIVRK